MNCTYKGSLHSALKLLTVAMLSMFLVACSSGGTDDDVFGSGTVDGDIDGDNDFGLGDNEDDDIFGGDEDDDDGFIEVNACQGQVGTDADSSDFYWDNNCTMGVNTNDGALFRHSTYSAGIQRVMACSGITVVVDGFFGDNTGNAVRDFQQAENDDAIAREEAGFTVFPDPLVVDGIVGPDTWERLQSKVELNRDSVAYIEADDFNKIFGVLPSSYTERSTDCTNDRYFYGEQDGFSNVIESWSIALDADSPETKIFGAYEAP